MAKRRWEISLPDGRHSVELEHGYFTGRRKLTVDGVTTTQSGGALRDQSGMFPFRVGNSVAQLRIATNGLRYDYDVVVDGRSVTTGRPATYPRPPFAGPGMTRFYGFLLLALSIPFSIGAGKAAYDEYRYQNGSAIAVAAMTGKHVIRGRGTTYQLSYAFDDANGARHSGADSVSEAAYESARLGDRYVVRYVSDDPDTNRFAEKDGTLLVVFLVAGDAATVALGAWLVYTGARRLRAARRLEEIGQTVSATVTNVRNEYMRGVGQVARVEYEYEDPGGTRRRGRGPYMYPGEAASYAVDARIRVLVDPTDPRTSLLR